MSISSLRDYSGYVTTPLIYPGGKQRVAKTLRRYLPHDIKKLVSPFFGGGGFEILLSQEEIDIQAYDIDKYLSNFWIQALNNNSKLVKLIRKIHPLSKEQFVQAQKKIVTIKDPLKMAAYYACINRVSYSGLTWTGYSSNLDKKTFKLANAVENMRMLDNLKFDKLDFRLSIPKHADDILYLDPPYMIDSTLYGHDGESHKDFDHLALAELLKSQNKWVLSYNDCSEIRNLYKQYKMQALTWSHSIDSEKDRSHKSGQELIILSHDLNMPDSIFNNVVINSNIPDKSRK